MAIRSLHHDAEEKLAGQLAAGRWLFSPRTQFTIPIPFTKRCVLPLY
jgi:hypothetical protein